MGGPVASAPLETLVPHRSSQPWRCSCIRHSESLMYVGLGGFAHSQCPHLVCVRSSDAPVNAHAPFTLAAWPHQMPVPHPCPWLSPHRMPVPHLLVAWLPHPVPALHLCSRLSQCPYCLCARGSATPASAWPCFLLATPLSLHLTCACTLAAPAITHAPPVLMPWPLWPALMLTPQLGFPSQHLHLQPGCTCSSAPSLLAAALRKALIFLA